MRVKLRFKSLLAKIQNGIGVVTKFQITQKEQVFEMSVYLVFEI